MKDTISREILWENGVQYGHKKQNWNPKMKKYIFGEKNGVHIINLKKTIEQLSEVEVFIKEIAARGGKLLFVGTKKQSEWAVKEAAQRTNNFYVNVKWVGGTLTNMTATIRDRVRDMIKYENKVKTNKISQYTANEQLQFKKRYEKQKKVLEGVRDMHEFPEALVIFDVIEDQTAIREANNHNVNVPVIALCDTNVDPKGVDYIIAGNDNHYKSIAYISKLLSQMYAEGAELEMRPYQERPPLAQKDIRKRGRYRRYGNFRRFQNTPKTDAPVSEGKEQSPATKVDDVSKTETASPTQVKTSQVSEPAPKVDANANVQDDQPTVVKVTESLTLSAAEALGRKHTISQLKEMAAKINLNVPAKARKMEICQIILAHQEKSGQK